MTADRRSFLGLAAAVPFAALAARAAAADAPCFDPAALPAAQLGMRKGLGFMAVSNDPTKHCSLCAFFKATQPGCGTCQLLSGGPVGAGSLCASFAAKPAG